MEERSEIGYLLKLLGFVSFFFYWIAALHQHILGIRMGAEML